MLINSPNISGSLTVTGNSVISGSLTVLGSITGAITGSATSASYVEYTNVANKPALVSGSSQVTYSGLTGIPSGIVSGSVQVTYSGLTGVPAGIVSSSAQVTYSGLTGIPSGIVSGSAQIASFGIFATTGSNGFNGSQSITGSLTVTGQVVAQTLNVQQVTSSIIYSSGSNVFGNSLGNTQQFTGSVSITGSLNTSIAAFGSAATVFLTSDSGTIKSRTAAQTLSDIAALPLAGGTLTGALNGTSATFSSNVDITGTGNVLIVRKASNIPNIAFAGASSTFSTIDGDGATLNFRGSNSNIGLSVANTLVTMGVALNGTSATFSGAMRSNGVEITNTANADILDIFQSPSTLNSFIDYPSGRSLIIRNKGSLGGLTLASTGAATFSSSVSVGGYLTGQGTNPGGLGGSRYVLDWLSGSMRVFSYGADASTNGGFVFNSQRSDGTNSQNFLSIASTGAATFASTVTLTSGYLSVDGFGNAATNYITMRSGFVPNTSGGIGLMAIDHSGASTDGLACYGHDGISLYTAQTEKMRITSDGYLRMAASTGGIQFNGDTAAANALDDYEEGTWTPVVGGTTGNPTVSYFTQLGKYVKIGRVVHIFCQLRLTSSSGGSGNLIITGLPFTISGDSDETGGSIGLALGFATLPTVIQPEASTSYVFVMVNESNTPITDLDFTYFNFTVTYLVNT